MERPFSAIAFPPRSSFIRRSMYEEGQRPIDSADREPSREKRWRTGRHDRLTYSGGRETDQRSSAAVQRRPRRRKRRRSSSKWAGFSKATRGGRSRMLDDRRETLKALANRRVALEGQPSQVPEFCYGSPRL